METKKEPEKVTTYKGYTETRKRNNRNYLSKFAQIVIRLEPEKRDALNALAAERGESVASILTNYINRLLETGEA